MAFIRFGGGARQTARLCLVIRKRAGTDGSASLVAQRLHVEVLIKCAALFMWDSVIQFCCYDIFMNQNEWKRSGRADVLIGFYRLKQINTSQFKT